MTMALRLLALIVAALMGVFGIVFLMAMSTQAEYLCQQCVAYTPAAATPTPTATPTPNTVPELARYEANMLKYGAQNCQRLKNYAGYSDAALNDTYYDGESVFYQISNYTGDTSWLSCAQASNRWYSQYVMQSAVPAGWMLFPHGFAASGSTQAYKKLLGSGAFVNQSAYNDGYQGGSRAWYAIRENSYALMVHLRSTDFGIPVNTARVSKLLQYVFLSLDQTYVMPRQAEYQKPFMTALAVQAMIDYDQRIARDPGILPRVKLAADSMWPLWLGNSFQYTDSVIEGTEGVPDLNLLIAPVYYWLWSRTHQQIYRERGDLIFSQGVLAGVNLDKGKQFNQNFRWSIQGLRWREL